MNESMEEMAEVMEDGLQGGCKRGPGLVNILECDMVVGVVGYLWLAHRGVSPSSQSLPRLSLCNKSGVSSL